MIPIEIEITSYDKNFNICKATTGTGILINIDPFVWCALPLSDEAYERGDGNLTVGKRYDLTKYSVDHHVVIPSEGGMFELK